MYTRCRLRIGLSFSGDLCGARGCLGGEGPVPEAEGGGPFTPGNAFPVGSKSHWLPLNGLEDREGDCSWFWGSEQRAMLRISDDCWVVTVPAYWVTKHPWLMIILGSSLHQTQGRSVQVAGQKAREHRPRSVLFRALGGGVCSRLNSDPWRQHIIISGTCEYIYLIR